MQGITLGSGVLLSSWYLSLPRFYSATGSHHTLVIQVIAGLYQLGACCRIPIVDPPDHLRLYIAAGIGELNTMIRLEE